MSPKSNVHQFQNTTDQSLREQIPLLREFRLIRDTRGHSRALCYTVENSTERYFMKIYPGDRRSSLQEIENIYNRLAIPTAQVAKQFYVAALDATVCLYEYLTGPTINDAIINMIDTDIEQVGYQVGSELNKFSVIRGDPDIFRQNFELELTELIRNTREQFTLCQQAYHTSLSHIDLDRLEHSLHLLKTSIYATMPTFIHNDVNLNNLIIHNGTPYFIDTDGGKIKSRALNFRGNCWWGWGGQPAEKEQTFYRGVYQGMFGGKVPDSFHRELSFVLVYEFFLRNQRYANNLEQIRYAFFRWYEILERANYFENYRFSWF